MEMKQAALLLNTRTSRNILFWLLFAFFHFYPRNSVAGYFVILAVSIVAYGVPVYANNLFLIPRYLLKRSYFVFSLLFLLLFAVTVAETYFINQWAGRTLPFLSYTNPFGDMGLPYHIFHITLLFTFLAFGKFLADAIQNQRSLELLQKQRLETELESLKAQINPHFLFNALNTIYGMARRTDQKTANAVITLSDILRHNIYESSEQYISMDKEISVIRQYVAFTQLRLHQKDNVKLSISGDVRQQRITPLLLLPFIENAIKHGLDKYVEHPYVKIELALMEDNVFFTCSNYCVIAADESKGTGNGIGLKNVQRRLELCYPGRHHLKIDTSNDMYSVALQIQLL